MDSPSEWWQSRGASRDQTRGKGGFRGSRVIAFTIDPGQALRLLLIVTAILVTLSLVGQGMVQLLPDFPLRDGFAKTLNVNREQSVPTLFASIVLLVGATLSGSIAHAEARGRRRQVRSWALIAIVLALMAIDESVSIHEEASEPLRELLGIERGPLFLTRVIPGAIAVILVAALLARSMWRLPTTTRLRLWAAAGLYVGGAIGMEMIGGSYASVHGFSDMRYALITTVEETLEMLGISLLLWALFGYIQAALPEVAWRLGVRSPQ